MQISITNGTLTSISETLSPSTGYALPTTIQVSGATSNYNSTTGDITLTSPTSTMSITAVGVETLIPPSVGNKDIVDVFVGDKQVKSMWLGNVKIYEGGAVEYTQDNDILTITNSPYSLSGDILTIGE